MKNSEEYNRYEYVVENIKDIIWELDNNFIFTYVSSSTKEAVGYEKNEVVGKCLFDFLTAESKEQVLDRWKERLNNFDNSDTLYEVQFLCRDGKRKWLEVSVKPILKENKIDCYVGVTRDISDKKLYEIELKKYVDELKNSNEKLRESEEKFRQLFEHMTNGFSLHEVITDEDGEPVDFRCIMVNKAYEKIMNQSMEQIVGRTIKETNPFVNEQMLKAYCKIGHTGESICMEFYSKKYSKYFAIYCFSPKRDQFASIFEDVTERKMVEIDLVKAKEIAENANDAKNEFLTLISHEFKTPLTVINSAIQAMELICKDELSDKAKGFINKIRQNSNRQLKLINNLLDITRINSGYIKPNMRDVDIVFITKSITDSIKVFAEQKNIKLSFYSTLSKKEIKLDEEKYERVLLNLLSNAIKFTPEGKSISVKVSQRIVNRKCKVCVQVCDKGIGIPENKKELIFERFGQVDNSLSRQAEGTGIGLYLVKMFVGIMGGQIFLESKIGVGSTFTILLPVERIKDTPIEQMVKEITDKRLVQATAIEFSDVYM